MGPPTPTPPSDWVSPQKLLSKQRRTKLKALCNAFAPYLSLSTVGGIVESPLGIIAHLVLLFDLDPRHRRSRNRNRPHQSCHPRRRRLKGFYASLMSKKYIKI